MKQPGRSISMLFDLFALNQRLRRLLAMALADAGLRADEYAVYSLLFEQGPLTATEMAGRMAVPLTTVLDYLRTMDTRGHLRRARHPRDGRAQRQWLRGVPPNGRPVGPSAHVLQLRAHRLLRQLAGKARNQTFPRHPAPDHPLV